MPTPPTTKHAEQRPDNTKPAQMQQPPKTAPVVQQKPQDQKPEAQRPKAPDQRHDPQRAKDNQYGLDPAVNTKPPDQGGGDQDPHPSPITDPSNSLPEPLLFDEENPRPKLARPGELGYVAGQPVDQAEYDKTEKEAADRVRPEAWERGRQQKARQDEERGPRTGVRAGEEAGDQQGTRPDGRPLRSPSSADDDINEAPGGSGGQGTRADGRARAPDEDR